MAEINELGTLLGLLQQGFTPDQARQQLDEAKAMQMAKMTGREMTRMGLIQGGQDLRRGLMAALGQEAQDPTLQMASRIRDLGNQFNTNTAEGMMQFANALAPINRQMAAQVAASARKMALDEAKLESEKALTAQRKREREAKDPRQEFIRANADKYTPESLDDFIKSGKFSDLKPVTKADATTKPPADFLAVAVELGFGQKPTFGEYTQEQVKAINQTLLDRGTSKAKAGAPKTEVVVPGMKEVKDVPDLRNKVLNTVAKPKEAYDAAGSAITLADEAIKNKNFAAAAALSRQLAKAAGEQQLSAADVRAFGVDPSLVGSIADVATKLATGTPTEDTLRKMKQLATVLRQKQAGVISRELDTQRRLAARSGFKAEDIEEAFGGILEGAPKGRKITTRSGNTVIIED